MKTTAIPAAAVTPVPLSTLHFASEAPKHLGLQVRKGDDTEGLPTLEASVRTHGVIVPLVVKIHDGKSYVTAGNRRLKLLRKIHGNETVMVPTVDSDSFDGDVREIAMATNIALPPHPVDRYEVIATLVKEGMKPVDAKERFGLSDRQFLQTMKLGELDPTIRDAWRTGEIDGEAAQAFSLTKDRKEQVKIFEHLKKNAFQGRIDAGEIRSKLVPPSQREAGKLVAFVGVDAVRKAKLLKNEDLFSTAHTVTDTKALKKLVDARIDEKCKALVDFDGWSWALTDEEIGTDRHYWSTLTPAKTGKATEAQQARMDELRALLAHDLDDDADQAARDELIQIEGEVKANGYSPEQRKKSGCILRLNYQGQLEISFGRVKPADKKKVEASERKTNPKKKAAADAKKKAMKPGEAVLTNALAERLSEQLQTAGFQALGLDHRVAVAAMIASFACGSHVIDVTIGSAVSMNNKKRNLDFISVFEGALKATPEQQIAMLAQVAAEALDIVCHSPESLPLGDPAIAAVFSAMNGERLSKAIQGSFDAKDYFASISRDGIVSAVSEAMGSEHASNVARMDKPKAAAFAATNVPQTGWLPPPLRTSHYAFKSKAVPAAAPGAGKKPAKKAAKKKAVAKKAKK